MTIESTTLKISVCMCVDLAVDSTRSTGVDVGDQSGIDQSLHSNGNLVTKFVSVRVKLKMS